MQVTAEITRMMLTRALDFQRCPNFPEDQRQRQKQRGRDEADHAEAARRSEPGGRPFHEHAIKRPAETCREGDSETLERDCSRLPPFLKANDPDRADQPQDRADLKLPLTNDPSFLRKKDQREERGEDDRGAPENGVDAGAHVKKSDRLRDLVDDVRQGRDEADEKKSGVQAWPALAKAVKDKWEHGEKADQITVKILRPGIVITVQVKLKERRRRPDEDGREDGGVSSGKCFAGLFCRRHGFARAAGFDSKETSVGLQSFNASI